jgi:uncharacterized protein (DUF2252 family)
MAPERGDTVVAAPPTEYGPTPEDRQDNGLKARAQLPPGELGELLLPGDRPDPVALLQEQAASRVPELVPLRHARMMVSPFTFYRGNALGMAIDLGAAPTSGFRAQICGDAHLSNFGLFASPERQLLFDLNDFDETMPGPWEWDVKRLVASLAVAGRGNGFSRKERRKSVRATARAYRDATARFATMRILDVWYAHADVDAIAERLRGRLDERGMKAFAKAVAKARTSTSLKAFGKLTERVDGRVQIASDPPILVPVRDLLPDRAREELEAQIRHLLADYRRTLQPDRRALLDHFRFVDLARKVVGVGSVGTRCWIALLQGRDHNDPLLLQVKEASHSVLKGHVPKEMNESRPPRNQGERVVSGQRMMQAASDIFLGWQRAEGTDGRQRDFYVRQLRDMKGSADVERMVPDGLSAYGQVCGWTLARAHARTGDAIAVASYLGDDDAFPDAMVAFAERYADQNERDYDTFCQAVREGRLEAAE